MASIEKRLSGTGAISYRVKVRLKGHPPQTAKFDRLTDAKRWEQSIESAIREGRHFKTAESKRHTLATLVDRYCNEVLARKEKNTKNARLHLGWWKKRFGSYALADMTPALIVVGRNELLMPDKQTGFRRSNATVVRYMAALSHAFTIAMVDWEWMDDNPMRRVTKPKEARGRARFLSDSERRSLLDACRESGSRSLYPVVVLALSTGMRRNEIMTLRWRQIELQRGLISLEETKNGDRRAVSVAGLALTLLTDLSKIRRIDTDLVFYGLDAQKPVHLTKSWMAAVQKAKLQDFRFHDLRHSAASYLAMNGATSLEIAAVLGHRTLQMVKRYSHVTNSHTLQVVRSMNEKIFGEMANG